MEKVVFTTRVLLALPFLVFGLNHYLQFMPEPEHPAAAAAYLTALSEAQYVWPIEKVTEVTCGALLLLGQWVPLALVLLAPILVNIVGYHVLLDPGIQGLGLALVLAACWVVQVMANMRHYRPFLLRVPMERGV